MKLSFTLRGILVLIADALFLWLLLDNRIDFLVTTFIVYALVILVSWFTHGFLYGVFAGKKAITSTKDQLKRTQSTQPGADSPAKKAKGYWIMQGIILAAFLLVTIVKHVEIAGMK